MSINGIRVFAADLGRRPLAALGGRVSDYLTSVGMTAFFAFLRISNRPLSWLERRMGRPLRANAIAWVVRRARG